VLLRKRTLAVALFGMAVFSPLVGRAQSSLQDGDILLICGDSITEQKMYSAFIEDYILMSQPAKHVRTIQIGWSGENVNHFANYWQQVGLAFHPTVATTNFGMNDGGYDLINDKVKENFREGTKKMIDQFKAANVRTVFVGTSGGVDTYYFKNPKHKEVTAAQYDDTLGHLSDIAKDVAHEEKEPFVDLHTLTLKTMAAAKSAMGEKFWVTGNSDGVHPGYNGHLMMAYAYLKAMGFDGKIGTITYDMSAGTADVDDAQQVQSAANGEITVVSTRYPFCFFGEAGSPEGTVGMLPFLPFNQDLNRYMLVVKNLKSAKAKVTWGTTTKEFTREQLSAGINLAAEFLTNPFTAQWLAVDKKVHAKQDFESLYIHSYINGVTPITTALPNEAAALQSVQTSLDTAHRMMFADLAASVTPVTHTIKIHEEE
jgi:GDSL-like Lipase/Acylhydrolase family